MYTQHICIHMYVCMYVCMYAYLYTTLYVHMTVPPSKGCRLGRLAGNRFFFRLTALHNMDMLLLVGGLIQYSRVGIFWGRGKGIHKEDV